MASTELRVDSTLRRIIVGFRVVTAVWITVLGSIAVVAWEARAGVVFGSVAVVWVWTGATFWLVGGGRFTSVFWLVVDLVVALLVVGSDALDGATQGGFVGGYPMSSVLLWGYAYGIPGGIGSAAAMTAGTVAVGDFDLAGGIVAAILYLVVGGVAAWAFEVLRGSEQGRLAARPASRWKGRSGSGWRSEPRSQPICTTRCCRRSLSSKRARPTRWRFAISPESKNASFAIGC